MNLFTIKGIPLVAIIFPPLGVNDVGKIFIKIKIRKEVKWIN
jgi:hypothetical protein